MQNYTYRGPRESTNRPQEPEQGGDVVPPNFFCRILASPPDCPDLCIPLQYNPRRPGSSQLHIITSPTDHEYSLPDNRIGSVNFQYRWYVSTNPYSSGRVARSQQAPYYRPSPAGTTASFLGLDSEVPHAGSGSSPPSTPRISQQADPPQRKQTVRFIAPTTAPAPVQTRGFLVVVQQSPLTSQSQFPEFSGSAET